MIKLPEGVEYSHVPIEKKYKSVTIALLKRILTIYNGIYRKFGQEGLDLIRVVSENYGKEIAELGKKKVKSDDVKSVGPNSLPPPLYSNSCRSGEKGAFFPKPEEPRVMV